MTTSFAQAQARLAARRQEREAEARAHALAIQSASRLRTQITASSSPLVRSLGSSVLSFWDVASSREGTRPAFRVGQVDAELLDEELLGLLKGQVNDALRYIGGGTVTGTSNRLAEDWAPEILLALRAVLFKLTLWDHDTTYGAALQNLKYMDARRDGPVLVPPSRLQKAVYGLVTVGGKYVWTKWEDWITAQENGFDTPLPLVQRLYRLTSIASNLHSAAALTSFLAFLVHGRYRTLLDRILRMRLAPSTSQVSREVSFEYLNRQLVWHAFTEFLLFFLPLIGINRWRRWILRTWRKTKKIVTADPSDVDGNGETVKKGEYAFLPERTCAICYQDQTATVGTTESEVLAATSTGGVMGSAQTDITNPYETIPCGCIYCFVCLATRLEREEGEGWECLRCGATVKECKPWGGDVLERPPKCPGAKAVAFADDVVDSLSKVRSASPDVPPGPEDDEVKICGTDEEACATPNSGSSDDNSELYEEDEDELIEGLP